jgi:hypothetical protein
MYWWWWWTVVLVVVVVVVLGQGLGNVVSLVTSCGVDGVAM